MCQKQFGSNISFTQTKYLGSGEFLGQIFMGKEASFTNDFWSKECSGPKTRTNLALPNVLSTFNDIIYVNLGFLPNFSIPGYLEV